MRYSFFVAIFLLSINALSQSKGTVTGVITDKEFNNEPMPFANVQIKGTTIGAASDESGKYSIKLEPGNHVLQFSFVGYEPVDKTVTVVAGETVTLDVALGTGSYTLQDVVVQSQVNRERQSALLLEQKNAVEIKQSIGATEMAQKGVTTVEGGVTKISGITKVGDRGIFVRGLDDRYNYLQINGLNFIPSDPNLKTIPLNYIPTDVVRNIDVFKTFNSSLYQDFAGASINIITKDISSKPFTKISVSAGLNTNTTFKDFSGSPESGGDFFGYTGNSRNLPSAFGKDVAIGYQASPSESRNMFNSSWSPSRNKAPLNTGLSITNSDMFPLENERKIGYIFNLNFSNSFLNQSGERRNLNTEGTAFKDFEVNNWRYQTQKSALASLNFKKSDRYNFFLNLIYLQNTDNSIQESAGENSDFITTDRPFFLRDIKYTENTSIGLQQLGTLYFAEKRKVLDYGIAVTMGKNDMPDRKILITEGVGEDADYVTFNGADPFRFFSELENFNVNGKLEYEYNFGPEAAEKFRHSIRAGYNGDLTTFDFFNRTIRVNGGVNLTDTTINTDDPQQFFDDNFDAGNLYYISTSDPTYKVEIMQATNAGLLNYTYRSNKFTVDLGARVEYLFRETKYRLETSTVNSPYLIKEYAPLDVAPVLNVKYNLSDRANLRFTASKTSTKPRVREILPFRYQDGDGNFTVGNPDLKNTQNYNIDFKYEIFPTSTSVFAAAVFGKVIQDPISRLVEGTSTGFLTKYDNFEEAQLFGLELEAAFGFDLFFEESAFAKRFSFGLNAILMTSKETADPEKFPRLTSKDRPLQGASDAIFNTDLSFDIAKSDKTESRVSFIYNSFLSRIYAVGTDGAADIEQQPIHQLDFTWRNTFSKKYQLNLTVRNLLDAEFLTTQDPTNTIADPANFSNVNTRWTQGINIGLEFSYTF